MAKQTCGQCYVESDARASVCPSCHSHKELQYPILIDIIMNGVNAVTVLFLLVFLVMAVAVKEPLAAIAALIAGAMLQGFFRFLFRGKKKDYWVKATHSV